MRAIRTLTFRTKTVRRFSRFRDDDGEQQEGGETPRVKPDGGGGDRGGRTAEHGRARVVGGIEAPTGSRAR